MEPKLDEIVEEMLGRLPEEEAQALRDEFRLAGAATIDEAVTRLRTRGYLEAVQSGLRRLRQL